MRLLRSLENLKYRDGSETDMLKVYILFEQPGINRIFAELLLSRGFEPHIAYDLDDIEPDVRVISEPTYFVQMTRDCQQRCLVVGEESAIEHLAPLCLTQPLTEAKVEAALEELSRL